MPKSRAPPGCTAPAHRALQEIGSAPWACTAPSSVVCSLPSPSLGLLRSLQCLSAQSPPIPPLPSSPEAHFTQPPSLAGCFSRLVSCLLANKHVPRSTPTACKATSEPLPGRGGGREKDWASRV